MKDRPLFVGDEGRAPSRRASILIVSPAATVPAGGGIGRLTEGLTDALTTFADVTLVGLGSAPEAPENWRVVPAGDRAGSRAVQQLRFLVDILRAVRRHPDAVHAVTWRAALPVAVLPRRWRPVLVVGCLGSELLRVNSVSRPLRDLVLRRASARVAISHYTAGAVHALVGRSSVLVYPPVARPPAPTHPVAARRAHPPEDEALRVLSVARLVDRKGHRELVEAVDICRRRGHPIQLTIAGGHGPEFEPLMRLQADRPWLSIEADVSSSRLEDLYQDADVFALLTMDKEREWEGFGIVLAEAAMRGLPTLAGASGAASEVVEDGRSGIVVSSASQAADALELLCADPQLRAELAHGALERSSTFDVRVGAERLRAVYRSLGVAT
jgi:phosphatidylinositol alpha-1,6-mannosyltransferase